MSPARRLVYFLAAPVLNAWIHLLWRTCRVRRLVMTDGARELIESGEPILPCFWHQRQFQVLAFLLAGNRRGRRFCALISPSVDGELATRVARKWGIVIVRGSATRTGGRAIREMHRVFSRERASLLIAADGPHGPAREAKSGSIVLAQLTRMPLLPMSFAARHSWHLKSWDRAIIPQPFTSVSLVVGEPMRVPRDLDSSEIAPRAERLGASLDEATELAESGLAALGR